MEIRSDFIIKELSLKNFMCYKEENLKLHHRSTIFCGPNSSGKSALIRAVEFVTTKRYKNEAEARHLARNGAEEDGFVKVLFDFEDDLNKVENISATRYFSQLQYVHLEHEGRNVRIGFDVFHKKFKLNSEISETFFSMEMDWNNLDNVNLLHFFKFNVAPATDEENIVEMAKELQRKESFSFVEKLFIEEEVLEMLWYSKHYDRKRIIKGEVQQNKFICPPCDEVDVKAEHEYNVLLAEISSLSLNEEIVAVEEQMHIETKEIDTSYDEYRKIIGGKADDFYMKYMECFKDAKKMIRKLVCDTVQLIEQNNETFRIEFSKILYEMTSDEAKKAVQQLIAETEPKMFAGKKQYLRQRKTLARLHRKFYRKQTKKDEFLEFLQSYKKKFTEHLATKYINLPDEVFDFKMELIELNQLWIQRDSLNRMRSKLEDCFSIETINAVDFIWDLYLTHDVQYIYFTLYTFNEKHISFRIEYDSKFDSMLPLVKFDYEDEYEQAKSFIQEENCKIQYKFVSSHSVEIKSASGGQFPVLDHNTVLALLNEWLIVLGENLKTLPSFIYSEDSSKVLTGGYVNIKRYELYKFVLAAGEVIAKQIAKHINSEGFENKYYWITSMWDDFYKYYNERRLRKRFDENNELCSNLCTLGTDILEAQQKSLKTFKNYHWYSAKLKLLKTMLTQSEGKVEPIDVSLEEYSLSNEEFTKKQGELHQYGQKCLNSLYENHYLSYMWSLNKDVIELQLSVFCEIVRLFDDRLNAVIQSKSEYTTKILEANEALHQLEIFQENYKIELNEQEEFLQRKHFPLNYGPNNLNWSNYEKSVYDKYKHLNFFEIFFKLRDSRDFIKFYKEKFGLEDVPDRKEMRLIIKNCEQLISLKKCLDNFNTDCRFQMFVDFTKEIDKIFRRISNQNVSVHFYVENDEDISDIRALDIDFDSFPNLITMIKDGTNQYLWTSMDRVFRFILVLSIYLAGSVQFHRTILCLDDCNVAGIFLQDFKQFSNGKEKIGTNYLQKIVDFCNEKRISLFMQCRETIPVNNCNLVVCQTNELGSKCGVTNISDTAMK